MSHDHTQAGATPVRASDAERDQAAEILRTGYAEGRLSRNELNERLAAAYAAKTRADLHDVTSDLPGAVSAPAARGRPAPAPLPIVHPGSGTGMGPNWCLLLCLLCAFPPAGIAYGIYWILTARRPPQLAVLDRPPLPGAGTAR
jgi:hypothetical protein